MTYIRRVSAWELRKHLVRQVHKMKILNKVIIIVFVLICLAISAHVIFYYNYLTDLRFNVLTEQGKISSAIQYRRNLAPIIIDSVASLVEHEDNVFNMTVDARERSLKVRTTLSDKIRAMKNQPIENMMSKIMAIGEQYPSLVSSNAFQLMMQQIAEAEKNILKPRTQYNDAVNAYTTAMSMFPGNIYAAIFNFPNYEYFDDKKTSEWERGEIVAIENVRRKNKKGNESDI